MIHVVGNAAIDTIYRVERFPLPGETIIANGMTEDIGGKGANQAIVAARAGATVRLVAPVGKDAAASRIRTALADEGVIDGLVAADTPTDRSSVYVDSAGENTIVSLTALAGAFDPLAAGALDGVDAGDVVLCQANIGLSALIACLSAARAKGALTVLNPSPVFRSAAFDWHPAMVVVLNRIEAEQLTGERDARTAAERLRAAGAGAVVVTLGADGAVMVGDGIVDVTAPKVDAVDTTGAGDVFCGMVTAMRARDLSFEDSLALAAGAAALSVTRRGVLASFPTSGEIEALMSKRLG
ncbi:MAG: ribokinase [Bauldia sp.]|nr:MAG: ribokinase [Bauldia sp.]